MRLWRTPLTDEAYVERVRKHLRIAPWLRAFYFILAIGFAILLISSFTAVIDNMINLAPAGQQNNMMVAFAAAASVGLVMGYFANQVIHSLAMSLQQFRTESLLVECWDKLVTLEDPRDQTF